MRERGGGASGYNIHFQGKEKIMVNWWQKDPVWVPKPTSKWQKKMA